MNLRFSVTEMLLLMMALPVLVGTAAFIKVTGYAAVDLLYDPQWLTAARHALLDYGFSAPFVAKYVSWILLNVPTWIAYLGVATLFASLRFPWTLALLFAGAILGADLVFDNESGLIDHVSFRVLSLLGAFVFLLSYTAMGSVCRFVMRTPEPDKRPTRALCIFLVLALPVAAVGWHHLTSARVGLEEARHADASRSIGALGPHPTRFS